MLDDARSPDPRDDDRDRDVDIRWANLDQGPSDAFVSELELPRIATGRSWSIATGSTSSTAKAHARWRPPARFVSCPSATCRRTSARLSAA